MSFTFQLRRDDGPYIEYQRRPAHRRRRPVDPRRHFKRGGLRQGTAACPRAAASNRLLRWCQVTSAVEAKWGSCIHVLVNNAALFVFKSVEVGIKASSLFCFCFVSRFRSTQLRRTGTAAPGDSAAAFKQHTARQCGRSCCGLQREHQGPCSPHQSRAALHEARWRRQHRVAGQHIFVPRPARLRDICDDESSHRAARSQLRL